MKKIFVTFALFCALIFATGCGGGSNGGNNQNDYPDSGDTVTDNDTDSGDSGSADNDPSDSGHEDPDTAPEQPDNGDSQPDGGDTAPDNGDTTPDSGNTAPDQDSDADTGSTEELSEGIYLGIIGFNYKLNIKPLTPLTNSNMTEEFQDFIEDFEMDDGTALYYADLIALKMLDGTVTDYPDYTEYTTPVPPNLQTVALVTFTDGEDTASDGEKNDPEHYNDPKKYLEEISKKIKDVKIQGLSVDAYSIGLKSGDTGSDFKSKLEKLASNDSNAFEVSDMEEVKARFNEIAKNLYHVFKTVDIDFKVLGNYSDGTRMRFTFDIYCDHDENTCEKNGSKSKLYIEATYRRSGNERSFEDFSYYGFSGNLTTVKCGERDQKGFYPCKFENLKYDNMDTENKPPIELWKDDNNEWKHENEALKQGESQVNDSKSSAMIMLVLDCTTSLGNTKFNKLKEAGKDFIETLVNGGSGVTGDSGDTDDTGDTVPGDTGDSDDSGDTGDSGDTDDTGDTVPGDTGDSGDTDDTGDTTAPEETLTLGNICTGQTTCYNASSSMTCPSSSSADFFGQDAQYRSKCTAQSFTVQTLSSQKVVLDNNTGLMWQQTAPSTTYAWENAKSYCSNLTYAGYSDWRLPSPVEFHTISDNGRYAPAFNTTYFQNITNSNFSYFWTSQERKADTTKAYYVTYYTAYSYIEAKTTSYNVMCVRGDELPAASFTTQTIAGEVVVSDSTTGLMWQKTYPSGKKTWVNALKYCENLVYAGYDDWRLPNKNEAASLLNYDKTEAPYSDFPDMPSNYFWSSSTHVYDTNYAWDVNFYRGAVDNYDKAHSYYVRCVR